MRVLITEEGKSNMPVAIITLGTEPIVIDNWVRILEENPGKYNIEIVMQYNFCDNCAKQFYAVYSDLMLTYEATKGHITETETKCAFIGALQVFAYSVEKEKLGD